MTKPATQNTNRIAKNTLFLYVRMLLTMGVSFYTVRVVLETLGVVDYGLYNVVGGVVVMFSFLSSTLATASQRFFAYELGRGDHVQLQKTFSMTLSIYILVGVAIFLVAETVGLWFLNNKMNIPLGRTDSVFWVYQFSVFSFIMTMFAVPYNAAIIAHEDMKVYAYVSVVEALLKLAIVYLLVLFSSDKLKLYAVLLFGVTTATSLIYQIYCRRKYSECRYTPYWNKKLFSEIATYSGWNLIGALASALNNQGLNIVLNMFFGPTVNAARAVAYQINTAVNQFVQNFLVASRPQITKYYAQKDITKMLHLVFQTSKFSFLLLSLISIPVLIETRFILEIWLAKVPDHTILFTKLVLINTLIDCFSYPLMAAAQATGNIKRYQLIVGGVMTLNLPIAYVLLSTGLAPETVFFCSIANSIVCLALRLLILRQMLDLQIGVFITKVLLVSVACFALSYYTPMLITQNMSDGIVRFLVVGSLSVITTALSAYSLGLTSIEKETLSSQIKLRFSKM
ncbi:lipopolysaccharide biosynthesis protein [Dyadobacter fermentans]|uniref:Polysaccharide biosynthesis protein n=1 Tax=Dyadobacter fermentans (strain ATCC 700827 / DSM 18053 / CIP 107007 / KCTC 52180 / NS114) TaxID=471854 RepID=C6VUM4_DYAFD|nr:oligosaccharide flippase family protein [Dyadobacter fermentans]ACT91333.1 polysaccharide biosynthesis protein [Dyadobacter fermentans DSM 18053]